jgi:hypothetical protein
VTKRAAIALLLIFAAACSSKGSPKSSLAPGAVNRPKAGVYVYTLTSTKGPTLPAGLERIETLSVSGDKYTSVISDNKNSNRVTYTRGWSSTGETLIAADVSTQTGGIQCAYNPPPRVLPIPLKVETLPRQTYSAPNLRCAGSKDIKVVGQETVKDGKGHSWSTYRIDERTNESSTSTTQIHWFSPELGADIRSESVSSSLTTLSVLTSHP